MKLIYYFLNLFCLNIYLFLYVYLIFIGPVRVNVSVAVLSVSPSQLHYRSYEGMRQDQSFEKVDPFTVRLLQLFPSLSKLLNHIIIIYVFKY